MNPSPPDPENGEGLKRDNAEAPETQNNYDKPNVAEAHPEVNTKPMPQDGCGYYYDSEGKRHYEPCVMPPQDAEPLSDAQMVLAIIGHGCSFAQGHPGKWAAWLFVTRYDLRSTADISESLKISQRSFQLYVKTARAWLDNLRAELEAGK